MSPPPLASVFLLALLAAPAAAEVRYEAARQVRQAGVVLLAAGVDGRLARAAVPTGRVAVAPRSPWLPRLRRPLLATALALLAAAVLVELWSFRSRST